MKFDLEKSLEELDQITSQLNSPRVSLAESLKLFKQGTQLVTKCRTYLNECEQQVKVLTERGNLDNFSVQDSVNAPNTEDHTDIV